ncbi:protein DETOXIFICATION 47, chloroplastic-like isoform X2 [Primulina eburnea]|uniref:protein DETOXIFICATION 47, chloroplastic-like isoform X2 n=1 Tax=Primulina eburnea TaxID=1245227 RepID=UPI003C6C4D18
METVRFSGPAVGLWIGGRLMCLIVTAVIGQGSSIELAALGFAGATNADIISAANTYVQIRTKTKLRKKNKNIFGDDDETNSIQDQSCYSVF